MASETASQTIRRLPELLGLPDPAGFCPGPKRSVHLKNKKSPGKGKVGRFSCNAWNCLICGARKKLARGLYYGERLALSNGLLFSDRISHCDWSATNRWLERLEADWVRIAQPDGRSVLFWSDPNYQGKPYCGLDEAIRDLGCAIAAIRVPPGFKGRFRPISASHDWQLPEVERRYTSVGWVRATNPDEVLRLLRGMGIEGCLRPTTGTRLWDVTFERPRHISEFEIHEVLSHLSLLDPKQKCTLNTTRQLE